MKTMTTLTTSPDFTMTALEFMDMWHSTWHDSIVSAYEHGIFDAELEEHLLLHYYGTDYRELREDMWDDFIDLVDYVHNKLEWTTYDNYETRY